MNNKTELKNRILKGIAYFKDVKPSNWNGSHVLHVKVLHELMENYINGVEVYMKDLEETKTDSQKAQEIFGI